MKKIVFTRFFKHLYYQNFFIEYHLCLFDHIYIFCHHADFNVVNKNIKQCEKVTVLPVLTQRHIGNKEEGDLCKYIYDYSIDISQKYIQEEDVLIYFADDDEFIELQLDKLTEGINGTVFYDWYIEPSKRMLPLTPSDILGDVKACKCKGRIWNLWDIPIFKDNLILLTAENIDLFYQYTTITGFHRLIKKSERTLILLRNPFFFKVHHLKGVTSKEIKLRVKLKLNQIKSPDDWDYRNCSTQFNRLYDETAYEDWYSDLRLPQEIDLQLSAMFKKYSQNDSNEQLFLKHFS